MEGMIIFNKECKRRHVASGKMHVCVKCMSTHDYTTQINSKNMFVKT